MIATYITKLQNGNVQVQRGSAFFSLNPDAQVYSQEGSDNCKEEIIIKDKSGSRISGFLVEDVVEVIRKDGTVTPINDIATLYFELSNFFFFKLGSNGSTFLGDFTNYDALVAAHPTAGAGDLAYVENSQGFEWFPGSFGGTFYSKGWYMWNGLFWDSSVDEIARQLEENTNDIFSLQTALTNHVNDLINPHDTSDANLLTSDILTNNVSTLKHGFAPKLPNDPARYLDGEGNYTVPSGSGTASIGIQNHLKLGDDITVENCFQYLSYKRMTIDASVTVEIDLGGEFGVHNGILKNDGLIINNGIIIID